MKLLNKSLILICCLVVLLALLGPQFTQLVECQEQVTVESRQLQEGDDLSATIRFLESLDQYVSQKGRPRFGRSDYKQPAAHRFTSGHLSGDLEQRAYNSLVELLNSRFARKYSDTNY